MGWVSFLEDIIAKRDELGEEIIRLQNNCISKEDKYSLSRVETIIRSFENFLYYFDPLIDFLTDPKNEDSVKNLYLKWEIDELKEEIKRSNKDLELLDRKKTNENKKAQEKIKILEEENSFLHAEIIRLRKENKKLDRTLSDIYLKHPEIGYENYPPKNPHKSN